LLTLGLGTSVEDSVQIGALFACGAHRGRLTTQAWGAISLLLLLHLARLTWWLISPLEVVALLTLWFRAFVESPSAVRTFFARCELYTGHTTRTWWSFDLWLLPHLTTSAFWAWWFIGKLEELALLALGKWAAKEHSATVRPLLSHRALRAWLAARTWRTLCDNWRQLLHGNDLSIKATVERSAILMSRWSRHRGLTEGAELAMWHLAPATRLAHRHTRSAPERAHRRASTERLGVVLPEAFGSAHGPRRSKPVHWWSSTERAHGHTSSTPKRAHRRTSTARLAMILPKAFGSAHGPIRTEPGHWGSSTERAQGHTRSTPEGAHGRTSTGRLAVVLPKAFGSAHGPVRSKPVHWRSSTERLAKHRLAHIVPTLLMDLLLLELAAEAAALLRERTAEATASLGAESVI